MKIPPADSGVSVVLVGSMNPAIFSPEWLARHNVVSQDLADEADIRVIHKEITEFSCGWCNIRVDRNRFQAQTNEAPYVRLCDLVAVVFGELLPNTPVSALGINLVVNFNAPSSRARDALGQTLAPAANWGKWGQSIVKDLSVADGKKWHGGVRSVTMQENRSDDRDSGWLSVRVEPSAKLSGMAGVFIEANDHYVIDAEKGNNDALAYTHLLASRFDESMKRSEDIIDQLMGLAHE